MTKISSIEFGGWKNNLKLENDQVELIVTLDVGPRIISLSAKGGRNIFKNYEEQLGQTGEPDWQIRGGHRLWAAPESKDITYVPDNVPVHYEFQGRDGVTLHSRGAAPGFLDKELSVRLDPDSSRVEVRHRLVNAGKQEIETASWGLTVMAPGAVEYIPQPPLGEHSPDSLLPNRHMVLWAYTDLSDPRWSLGSRFIRLRQDAQGKPTKLGLRHREKWAAVSIDGTLFIKTVPENPQADYPDFGCNFETFTNEDMLEIETLGPLRRLAPGEAVEHTEVWGLWPDVKPEGGDDEILKLLQTHARKLVD